MRLAHNASGANLVSGVTSALLSARNAELGLFEVDEAALPEVARRVRPRAVCLGNLFRDQLDRYGELEHLAERWRGTVAELPPEALLVVNGDDPQVGDLARERPGGLVFGLDDPRHAQAGAPARRRLEMVPFAAAIRTSTRPPTWATSGDYRCPACGHGRPPLDVSASDIELRGLESVEFTLVAPAGERRVRLAVPGLYNVYNALAAASLALALGAGLDDVQAGLERFGAAFGRFERIAVGGRSLLVLLVKNPAGANEAVRTLVTGGAPKLAVVALNDAIADGRDVSWIWDVDWEPLLAGLDRVVVTGERAAEMALRCKYGGLPARGDRGRAGARSCARSRARADRGGRRARGPPHVHGHAGPAQDRLRARVRPSVLGACGVTALRVAHLYPEYLNIYADRGNIAVLANRAAWRGIELAVEPVSVGEALRPGEHDLIYIGGGQDREQALIAPDLAAKGEAIREAVGGGTAVLAVCGGYQLLGRFYRDRGGAELPGRRSLSAAHGCGRAAADRGLPARMRARAGREAHAGGLREPRGAHSAGGRRGAARPRRRGLRQRRRERFRGLPGRNGDRHVPPRAAAARGIRGLPTGCWLEP